MFLVYLIFFPRGEISIRGFNFWVKVLHKSFGVIIFLPFIKLPRHYKVNATGFPSYLNETRRLSYTEQMADGSVIDNAKIVQQV